MPDSGVTSSLAPVAVAGLSLPVSTAPAQRDVSVPLFPSVFDFPVHGDLSGSFARLVVDPRRNHKILSRLALYESVHLVSASFVVRLMAGSHLSLHCTVTGDADPLDNPMSAPIWRVLDGAAYGNASMSFALGDDHAFGRELKAPALGNASPVFCFDLTGAVESSVTTEATVRGVLQLSVRGVGVLPSTYLPATRTYVAPKKLPSAA